MVVKVKAMILDRTCFVSHLTKDSNNPKKESYVIDLGLIDVPINIQPGGAEDTILSDGVFAQTWVAFTVMSGIRTGDLVTISGGLQEPDRKFVVKGIEFWNMLDLPHFEYTLTEFVENEVS